jgi:hypothetical protein
MGQLGSSPLESVNPVVVFAGLAWREFGRTADLIPMISAIGPDQTTHRLVPTLLLVAHAELRDHDRARPLLDAVAADDFAGLFTTFATGTTLALCAEACWLLGDRARAAQLRRHLEPYRGQVIVIPIAAGVLGAADHFLGLLAHTLDDRETAAKELEAALAIHRGIRSPLLIGHSAVALARVLDDDDPRRAALLGEAADIARRLTLPRLATSVDQAQPGGGD